MKRLALLAMLAGCFGYSDLPNNRPDPHLRQIGEARILDMKVNLYKQPGLCPGKEGKLYANATVQWPNAQPVPRSIGADVDSLQPNAFGVSGPLIKGDDQAHLFPSADVLASVETGFETDIVYKPNSRYSFHEVFPPEYSCFDGYAVEGQTGGGGGGGNSGYSGNAGENGTSGGNGGPGERGGQGGRIEAFVTVVSTKFYPRLFAVRVNDTFFLAPADRALTFDAAGGQGGGGGAGGNGGNGGDQKVKEVEETDDNNNKHTVRYGQGPAGNGGNGGNGAVGGDGGSGGNVVVTYDSAFPELRTFIQVNVNGGPPGEGGGAGGGGAGGSTNADKGAQQGSAGNSGQGGYAGRPGNEGRASVRAGAVGHLFNNLHGITVLGNDAAPTPHRRGR